MIILEGLDATGKSTLAQRISEATRWTIKPSEGPEKYPGEAEERARLYLSLPDNLIFDRHPLISQFIYGPLSGKSTPPLGLLQDLKALHPFVIEAVAGNHGEHITKEHDTPEHLEIVNNKRDALSKAYTDFFSQHFPYRWRYKFGNEATIIKSACIYTKTWEKQHAL